jgi:peptidoglycan/LPS O-acetylase OafA/YrhL
MKRLEWIDCLRGYAIIGVIAIHLDVFPAGGRGVQLFFVASAIALMYARSAHKDTSLLPFFTRRFFRIVTMLWAAIPLFLLEALLTGTPQPDIWQIFSTATLTSGDVPAWQNSVVPGSWSIVCEAMFYLVFPFLAMQATNTWRAAIVFVVSILFAAVCWPLLARYAGWTGVHVAGRQHEFAFFFITSQLPCFALGILVFRMIEQGKSGAWFAGAWFAGVLGVALIVALCFVQQYADRLYLAWAFAFGSVAFALANGQLSLLVNRPAQILGMISYSLYFWHFFVLHISRWLLPTLGTAGIAAIVVGFSIPLATLTYLTIERPMMRLGARLAALKTNRLVAG